MIKTKTVKSSSSTTESLPSVVFVLQQTSQVYDCKYTVWDVWEGYTVDTVYTSVFRRMKSPLWPQ